MTFYRHKLVRQLVSIFLMALILFIDTVKLLHTHQHDSGSYITTPAFQEDSSELCNLQYSAVHRSHNCLICGYILFKDAALVDNVFSPPILNSSSISFAAKQCKRTFKIVHIPLVRGPPINLLFSIA